MAIDDWIERFWAARRLDHVRALAREAAARRAEEARAADPPAPAAAPKRRSLKTFVHDEMRLDPEAARKNPAAFARDLYPKAIAAGFKNTSAQSIETRIHEEFRDERLEKKERRAKSRPR
jgi:hypothetical protein